MVSFRYQLLCNQVLNAGVGGGGGNPGSDGKWGKGGEGLTWRPKVEVRVSL